MARTDFSLTKSCTKCNIEQALDAFPNQSRGKYGKNSVCKECCNIKSREWYSTNATKKRAQVKEWTAANRELKASYQRMWRAANLEQKKAYYHRRRAVESAVQGSFTGEEWAELCAYYDNRCVCCNKSDVLTMDHIIPITWPGTSNYISNIQPLCKSCNSAKRNLHATNYLELLWLFDARPVFTPDRVLKQ